MILGIILIVIGIPLALYGSTKFNFGIFAAGWLTAIVGTAFFVAALLSHISGVYLP